VRAVGLFEAKTKLSEICERVARSGQSVVITRRGKPLVRIEPLPQRPRSVWEERERYIAEAGRMAEEFELPERSRELPADALDD
jgi:prevent-host-death family protein